MTNHIIPAKQFFQDVDALVLKIAKRHNLTEDQTKLLGKMAKAYLGAAKEVEQELLG